MRYDRQQLLPDLGKEGQEKLSKSKVLIVGVGGLGSPISLYLTGAGVGTLGLIDDDVVSTTNLHRQVLYTEEEVGKKKAICARERLSKLNDTITIHAYHFLLTKENAAEIIGKYDIVVDGSDNFSTRYLINDTCVALNKIYVYGAICGLDGQVSVFNYQGGPTYRDLFPDEKEMLEFKPFRGVLGTTPGVVGSMEATQVIKIICGFGEILSGKLWTIDLKEMVTNSIEFAG